MNVPKYITATQCINITGEAETKQMHLFMKFNPNARTTLTYKYM